jgi:hypothetical protein
LSVRATQKGVSFGLQQGKSGDAHTLIFATGVMVAQLSQHKMLVGSWQHDWQMGNQEKGDEPKLN